MYVEGILTRASLIRHGVGMLDETDLQAITWLEWRNHCKSLFDREVDSWFLTAGARVDWYSSKSMAEQFQDFVSTMFRQQESRFVQIQVPFQITLHAHT